MIALLTYFLTYPKKQSRIQNDSWNVEFGFFSLCFFLFLWDKQVFGGGSAIINANLIIYIFLKSYYIFLTLDFFSLNLAQTLDTVYKRQNSKVNTFFE
jgi:hypothetical protein